MAGPFDPLRSETLSDKVIARILEGIESGTLAVGDRLPSERQLAEELEISRVPVREAFSTLKAMGVIEARPGVGTSIIGDGSDAFGADPWTRWMREHTTEIVEVLEVREAIDAKAAALSAERATEKGIVTVERIVSDMEACVGEKEFGRLVELDIEFHDWLSRMSGNSLLTELRAALDRANALDRQATFRLPGRPSESAQEHRAIVRAIADGNPEQAAAAAAQHVKMVASLVRNKQLGDQRKEDGHGDS
jgi:GntR family transcriptional repressor for pyruvate dehydrogenase complex